MAIAFDATCSLNFTLLDTSLTTAFTVGGGSNRLLIVEAMVGSASDIVSGVTFHGVTMTRSAISAATTDNQRVYTYYLVAPDTGTFNIVISTSSLARIDCRALSYTGVHQTTPLPTTATNTATGTIASIATSITVSYTNAWVVGAFRNNNNNTCSLSPGALRDNSDGNDSTSMGDTNAVEPPGGITLTYSFTSATTSAAAVLMVLIATDSTFVTPGNMFMFF